MKKVISCFSKNYINRLIALVTLQLFMLSITTPVRALPKNDIFKDKNKSEEFSLVLSYSIDIKENSLCLVWNKNTDEEKSYYIFKKMGKDGSYILLNEKGIKSNYFKTDLMENIDSSFIVSTSNKLSSLPEDVKLFSYNDIGDTTGRFRRLKDVILTESNPVEIKVNLKDIEYMKKTKYTELDINEIEKNNEDSQEINKENKKEEKVVKKEIVSDPKKEEKFEKVEEEVIRVCSTVLKDEKDPDKPGENPKPKPYPAGFFPLDPNKDNTIKYKGTKLNIPKGSIPVEDDNKDVSLYQFEHLYDVASLESDVIPKYSSEDELKALKAFIFILPLNEDKLINTPSDSPNNIDLDGYKGFEINLFIKKKKTNKNVAMIDKNLVSEESNELLLKIDDEDSDYYWEAVNKFNNDIDISIKYTESSASYISNESTFIYYYDKKRDRWTSLERASLDKETHEITSKTDHFCQFYTGAMTIQTEPPQAKGINTKPINIQAVDPMAGITTITPPTPNNQGAANVSYPITVPEGINGLTPQLSINYSSDGKEGDCGYGWNLSTSKIERDTRNGVPQYNDNDRLMLDGAEIIKISDGTYRYKVEGAFARIVPNGGNFIVYQTDGSVMYYGQYGNSNLGNFKYYLSRVKDKFGNVINYEYTINGGNRYLSKITYGYDDVYTVNFEWGNKNDIVTSYRSKSLIKYGRRLNSITIKYKDEFLKKYELSYGVGAFNKSILKKISEKDKDENSINFEYDVNIDRYFTGTVVWPTSSLGGTQDLRYSYSKEHDLNYDDHTEVDFVDVNGDGLPDRVFKYRDDSNLYVQLNTGAGFTGTYAWPTTTLGGDEDLRYSYNKESDLNYHNHTEVDFVDVNGDGLPDRVYKHCDDSNFYIQLNACANKNILKRITNTKTGVETNLGYKRVYLDPNRGTTHNYRQKNVLSCDYR